MAIEIKNNDRVLYVQGVTDPNKINQPDYKPNLIDVQLEHLLTEKLKSSAYVCDAEKRRFYRLEGMWEDPATKYFLQVNTGSPDQTTRVLAFYERGKVPALSKEELDQKLESLKQGAVVVQEIVTRHPIHSFNAIKDSLKVRQKNEPSGLVVYIQGVSGVENIKEQGKNSAYQEVAKLVKNLEGLPFTESPERRYYKLDVPKQQAQEGAKYYLQANLISGRKRVVVAFPEDQASKLNVNAKAMDQFLDGILKTATVVQQLRSERPARTFDWENHSLEIE